VTDGTVTAIFYSSVLGWVCEFKSDEHGIYVGHSHLYCNKHDTVNCDGKDHADATCMKSLKVGDKVTHGQWIGRVGDSGSASRGSHLHMTMSKKPDPRFAKTFDPEKFLDQKEAHAIRQAKKAKEVTPEPAPAPEVAPEPQKPKPILHTLGIRMGRFWHFKK
jgi:hypothetical protein